jgi:Carboxypeptidase regulatory-like domain
MRFLLFTVLPLICLHSLCAQTVTLRGVVLDQTGAVVPGATVVLTAASDRAITTATRSDGTYAFTGLQPGNYTVEVSAPGLALAPPAKINLKSGVQMLNLQLKLTTLSEKVTVNDAAGSAVTPDPAGNASAIILRGDDLDALSDDPTNLEADLQALAGPAAGPNGGAIYIDGFSGGQLPSKDSIREVRINQNPFSPEYDKPGFGRVEIFTKPGSDRYRGSAFYNFADDFWNSRNPYAAQKATFLLREYGGNVGGPLNKRSSFFLDVRRDATDNGSIINGITLDPTTLGAAPFTDVYPVPQRAIRVSPRIDYQLTPNNTLTFRYGYSDMDIPGAGVGGFNLISRGYDAKTTTHTVQISEATVLSATVVNEIRFQYFRSGANDQVDTPGTAIQVLGSFNGGGATVGNAADVQSSYELQDYVTVARGSHTWRSGIRLRGLLEDTVSPQNFNGTFTFSGGLGPQLDANNRPVLDASGQPVVVPIQSIEQYRRTLFFQQLSYPPDRIRQLGGGANQFTVTTGNPALSAGQFDFGAFVGDDWRVRPNFTLSLGLRYETQTNIHDWRDFAPRMALAWALGAKGTKAAAKTVIRAGFGTFYDRFSLANTLTALRYGGSLQHQYVIANPDFFPVIPPVASFSGLESAQIIEKISSTMRAPYIMQSALGVERQLPWNTTVAVTYANSHGLHLLRSRDINAPLPGTYDPNTPGSGQFPFGGAGPIFLMESAGLYNQNQLIVNVNSKVNRNVSLMGSYMLNRALSNTDGLGTFPANQYDLSGEYGPAATDVRNRMSLGGSLNTKWDVRLSPFIVLQSGPPFDITVGQDLYGTTVFNARPGIALDPNKEGVIRTPYGLLDSSPTPDERILPRNYGRGPGLVRVNLRVSKTIGIGPAREASSSPAAQGSVPRSGGGGVFSSGGIFSATPVSRRYNLVISMQMENLLNHNNPGPIIGNMMSPLFGQANQPAGARDLGGGGFSESANNRRLELQVRFNF